MASINIKFENHSYVLEHVSESDCICEVWRDTGMFYEQDLLHAISERHITGVYIDVGANVGNHSLWFVNHTDCTELHAFEPVQLMRTYWTINMRQANRDIHYLYPFAAFHSYTWGTMAGMVPSNHNCARFCPKSQWGMDVRAIPLDCLFSKSIPSRPIGLIKIDVEGMESDVLLGAKEILLKDKPLLVVEANNDDDFDRVDSLLKVFGYRTDKHDYTRNYAATYLWSYAL